MGMALLHGKRPMTLLNEAVLAERHRVAEAFRAGQPFPHVVIDNFLIPGFCEKLLQEFPQIDRERAIREWNIPRQNAFATWEDLAAKPHRFAGVFEKFGDVRAHIAGQRLVVPSAGGNAGYSPSPPSRFRRGPRR